MKQRRPPGLIAEVRAGTLHAWRLHRAATQGATLTFTADGRIAAYWLTAGARRAMVRAQYQPRRARSGYRPAPAAPPILTFWGDIATLTATEIVLVNVTTRANG